MRVGEFECVNEVKLKRAIEGSMGQGGKLSGGVGVEASDEEVLVAYDKLAGLILKGGLKVKHGCFWDFDNKEPFKEPKLVFVVSIDKKQVEVTEEEAKAIDSAKKKSEELKSKAKDKPKKQLRRKKKETKEEPKE